MTPPPQYPNNHQQSTIALTMSQKIRIKLKSYDHNLVDKSAEKIVKTVKATGAVISGPIPLPTHKRIFTVNRSTFVNKKSREQFQLSSFKRLIDIYNSTAKTVDALMKLELLMNRLGITCKDRPPVVPALEKAELNGDKPAMAMELPDGRIVTGKTSSLLGASSACLLNALKALAGIDKKLPLIAPGVIEPIQHLKVEHLGNHNPRLHTDELLIALSICAVTNPMAGYAIDQLGKLRGCEAHSSVILSHVDEDLFKKLGVNITFEPKYQAKKLFHKN